MSEKSPELMILTTNKEKIDFPQLTRKQTMELDACIDCGECVKFCPVFDQLQREGITARGKIRNLREMVKQVYGIIGRARGGSVADKNKIDKFVEDLYLCTVCGQCQTVCESRLIAVIFGKRFVPIWFVKDSDPLNDSVLGQIM